MTIVTTTDDPAAVHVEESGSAPEQWRGESIQLIDWGNMSGHTQINLDGGSALFTGPSGTGKSTLLDAVLALMQSSTARFNSASNATAGRARSGGQRTELTYLTGKIDDVEREDGEMLSLSLRPASNQARWGAVAMTFRSTRGERYTIIRAYYVPKAATDRNEIKQRCATIDGPFDLMQLRDAAHERFDMRPMRALGLKPYDGPGPFRDAMFKRLGFGRDGAKVVDLLRRIQSGAEVPSVDALFSEVVLEEPVTFEQAQKVEESFTNLKATYDEMRTTSQKLQVLRPIPELKEDLDAAHEELADLASLRLDYPGVTPFMMWAAFTERDRRQVACQLASEAIPVVKRRVDEATETHLRSTVEVRGLEGALNDESAGLNALRDSVEQAAVNVRTVTQMRTSFDKSVSQLGVSVDSEAQHADLFAGRPTMAAKAESQRQHLSDELLELGGRKIDLRRSLQGAERELASLEGRAGRIPEYFDSVRNQIAERLGWEPGRLPFLAELIDVQAAHAQWRTAAEAVLGGIGLRLAVPPDERVLFQKAIDGLRIDHRIHFDFVKEAASFVNVHDEQRLISRLELAQEYPFLPWLIERVYRSGGRHLLVDDVADLAIVDGESRVARSGQVSERLSGAHGGGQTRILGFSNDDLKADLAKQIATLETQTASAESELDEIEQRRKLLDARQVALSALDQFTVWSALDVAAARTRHQGLVDRLEELRRTSDRIRFLEQQLDDAGVTAEKASIALHNTQNELGALTAAVEAHQKRLGALDHDLTRLERGEVSLTDAQVALCDLAAAKVSIPDDLERIAEAFDRVRRNLQESVDPLNNRLMRAEAALKRAFTEYRREWGDIANDPVEPAAYDEYAAMLRELEASGLDQVRDDWCARTIAWSADDLLLLRQAFREARSEIRDRIHRINDLLETVPFGADEDRLELDVRDQVPPRVQDWRRELDDLASNITDIDAIEDSDERFAAIERRFGRINNLIDKIRSDKDRGTSQDTLRRDVLDVRRHVYIRAHRVHSATKERMATYSSFEGKSGGESEELTAFITGAALRFRLGSSDGTSTTYTPVFLDEGFVKADGQFTGRAVQAWEALGFQLIVAVPVEKFSAMEPYLEKLFVMSKDSAGRGYCDRLTADEIRAQLGVE